MSLCLSKVGEKTETVSHFSGDPLNLCLSFIVLLRDFSLLLFELMKRTLRIKV